jgi:fatty acid synthase
MSVLGATVPTELETLGVHVADKLPSDLHLAVARNLTNMDTLVSALKPGGFLIVRDAENDALLEAVKSGLIHVATQTSPDGKLVLLRKEVAVPAPTVIFVKNTNFEWVEDLREALQSSERGETSHVLVVSEEEETSGVLGLVNCLKQEPGGTNLR